MEKIVIVDLETTGLCRYTNKIVEISILVLDTELHELGAMEMVIPSQPEDWEHIDPIVTDMHTKNGLKEESLNADRNLGKVEQIAMGFLQYNDATGFPMAGSSVHFDRGFLEHHMPSLEQLFHYRLFDVSGLRQFIEWQFEGIASRRKHTQSDHRALSDCRATAAELRHYVEEYR
jgi:oligoribonuclease